MQAYYSVFFTNPFAWALRSIVLNEWSSPDNNYQDMTPVYAPQAVTPTSPAQVLGHAPLGMTYAYYFGIPWGDEWRWAGVAYVLAYASFFTLLSMWAVARCRPRVAKSKSKAKVKAQPAAVKQAKHDGASQAHTPGKASATTPVHACSEPSSTAIGTGSTALTADAASSKLAAQAVPSPKAAWSESSQADPTPSQDAVVAVSPAAPSAGASLSFNDSDAVTVPDPEFTMSAWLPEGAGSMHSAPGAGAVMLPLTAGRLTLVAGPPHAGYTSADALAAYLRAAGLTSSATPLSLTAVDRDEKRIPVTIAVLPAVHGITASPWQGEDKLQAAVAAALLLRAPADWRASASVDSILAATGLAELRAARLDSLQRSSWNFTAARVAIELASRPDILVVELPREPGLTLPETAALLACLRRVAAGGASQREGASGSGSARRQMSVIVTADAADVRIATLLASEFTHAVHLPTGSGSGSGSTEGAMAESQAATVGHPSAPAGTGSSSGSASITPSPMPDAATLATAVAVALPVPGAQAQAVGSAAPASGVLIAAATGTNKSTQAPQPPASAPAQLEGRRALQQRPESTHWWRWLCNCRAVAEGFHCARPVGAPGVRGGFFRSLAFLLAREVSRPLRDRKQLIGRSIITPLFLGLFVGVLFANVDTSGVLGASVYVSLGFVTTVLPAMLGAASGASLVLALRPGLYKDWADGAYTPEAWAVAYMLSEAVWAPLSCLLWITVSVACAGVMLTGTAFAEQLVFTWGASVAGSALGALLAFLAPHAVGAWVLEQIAFTLSSTMAGLFVPTPQMPASWKWLQDAMAPAHFLRGVLSIVFHCHATDAAQCPSVLITVPDVGPVSVPVGTFMAGRFGFDYSQRWHEFAIGVGITACIAVAVPLAARALRVPWVRLLTAKRHRHQRD